MLETFIKNKGTTKTIIHNNNKNYYNEIQWDADYDGKQAKLSLDIDKDGSKEHMDIKINNDELAELLNIPSENNMLDKRLYNDFLSNRPKKEYKIIEIPKPKSILSNRIALSKDSYDKNKKNVHFLLNDNENNILLPLENEINNTVYTHISSPKPQEDIIFPLGISQLKTRKHRNHRNIKPHVTYKIYRKNKSLSKLSKKTLKKHSQQGNHTRRSF
jgi:hypothetical protein